MTNAHLCNEIFDFISNRHSSIIFVRIFALNFYFDIEFEHLGLTLSNGTSILQVWHTSNTRVIVRHYQVHADLE